MCSLLRYGQEERLTFKPTIVEETSFNAWQLEAFRLGHDWSTCYPAGSPSRRLIETIMDECYLVNIVGKSNPEKTPASANTNYFVVSHT